eukprot:TRINITY_DN6289_c1_g2_i4.p5 TRINITY_DN6289_c1_g2~~TRINITY_DN6289_c1_g2_i4.p5  ORF type:complete len:149 (-),score=6.59 TRINITY_DN6289_c1_g2_i4:1266-1712(-)
MLIIGLFMLKHKILDLHSAYAIASPPFLQLLCQILFQFVAQKYALIKLQTIYKKSVFSLLCGKCTQSGCYFREFILNSVCWEFYMDFFKSKQTGYFVLIFDQARLFSLNCKVVSCKFEFFYTPCNSSDKRRGQLDMLKQVIIFIEEVF